jgi:hypothetical protein
VPALAYGAHRAKQMISIFVDSIIFILRLIKALLSLFLCLSCVPVSILMHV